MRPLNTEPAALEQQFGRSNQPQPHPPVAGGSDVVCCAANMFHQDLEDAADNDDVQAARLTVAQLAIRNVARWAAEAGPLPNDLAQHAVLVDTVRRGAEELRTYLNSVPWP